MKHILKKFTALLLSLALLLGASVSIWVSADSDEETAKNNLISAWQTIASESKLVKETLAVPREEFLDAAGNNHSRIEVTSSTQVAGAGLSDPTVLGDYYAEYVKFSTTGSAMGWSYVPTMVPVRNDIKLTEYDTVYMYLAAFDANKVQANYAALGVQLNNGNSGSFNGEFYSANWKKFTFNVTADSIGNPKIIFNHGTITYVSFGSIIGEKTVTGPILPANYQDMTISELVFAAKEIDYKGFPSTSQFEIALAAASAAISPEAKAFDKLITAWQSVAGDTKEIEEVIAIAPENTNDVDGNSHPRTEITDTTVVEGLGDPTILGNYYVNQLKFGKNGVSQGWNYMPSMGAASADIKLKSYDEIYAYVATYGENKAPVSVSLYSQLNNGVSGDATVTTSTSGWTKMTFNATQDDFRNGVKFICVNSQTVSYLSYGSLIGKKNIKGPAVPTNYVSMSLPALVKAAKDVDVTGFASADAFISALAEASALISEEDMIIDELVTAWKKLNSESKLVVETLAVPRESFTDIDGNIHGRIAVTADTQVVGNNLGNVSNLGDYYAEFVKFSKTGNAAGWSYTPTMIPAKPGIKLTEYNTVYMYLAAFDANKVQANYAALSVQLNNGNSGHFNGEFYSPNWKKFTFNVTADSIGDPKIIFNSGAITYVSFGSIIGEKTVYGPALPENYKELNLREIVLAAKAIDCEGYVATEEFKTALLTAENYLDPEELALEDLISAWKAVAGESKRKKDILAIPAEYTNDVDGNAHPRTEVIDTTVVEGLGDPTILGNYYVNQLKFGKNGVSQGWNYMPSMGAASADIKLKSYDEIYAYVATYGENKVPVSVSLYAQLSHGGSGDGSVTTSASGWTKMPFNPTADSLANGVKFICTNSQSVSYISYGSLIGEKTVMGPALPDNYENLSIKELYDIIKVSDYEGFASSDKLIAAIVAAEAFVDKSYELKEKLLEEWNKLEHWYTEEIAVPRSYTDDEENTYEPIAVTDSTVVGGLANADVLGSYYIDKFKFSTTGWTKQLHYTYNSDCANLAKYSKITTKFAVYNENGEFVEGNCVVQINGVNAYGATGKGWTTISFTDKGAIDNIKLMYIKGISPAYVSFGSIIGEYVVKPEIPANAAELPFAELVKAADACDVSGYDTDNFVAVLTECKNLLANRRNSLATVWDKIGEKPSNFETMSESELASAARELTTDDSKLLKELSDAVWKLYVLTDDGNIIDKLSNVWSKITDLPENYKLFTPEEWIGTAEVLDISEATEEQQSEFNLLLDAVRDLLSKGKADAARLKDLVTKANQMNYYDFTAVSWAPFGLARDNANAVLANYANVTQKTVDAAADELYSVWGDLKMYVRSQMFDFMEYFLKTNPDLGMSYSGADKAASVVGNNVSLPNGANGAIKIATQTAGWSNPAVISGANLEDLAKYEIFEIWYKADITKPKHTRLVIQMVDQLYKVAWNIDLLLPQEAMTGEWYRLEIPLTTMTNNNASGYYTLGTSFSANNIRIISPNGEGNFMLGNFVLVNTESVEAGIVPNVPKMAIIEREEIKYEPPKNPFTGVDRGDPWGREEKKNKPPKQESDSDSSAKDDEQNNSTSSLPNENEDMNSSKDNTTSKPDNIQDMNSNSTSGENTSSDNLQDTSSDAESDDDSFEDDYDYEDDYDSFDEEDEPSDDEDASSEEDNESDEPELVESGECGSDLTWEFYSDGRLVISGSGDMDNFPDVSPWIEAGCDVTSIEFIGEITSIGDSAFYGCKNLSEVTIPDSITKIGVFAFYECDSLKYVKVPSNVKEVGAYAFGYVFDTDSGKALLLDDFKLDVTKPSAAYNYARNYEVDFDVYDSTETVADTNDGGIAWWIWLLIGLGGVAVLGGVIFLSIVLIAKKK